VTPSSVGTYTYRLSCNNAGGGASGQVTVTVTPQRCFADPNRNNCRLQVTPSGSSDGQCIPNYTGNCEFSCYDGTWTQQSNDCRPNPPQITVFSDKVTPPLQATPSRRLLLDLGDPLRVVWDTGGFLPNQCRLEGVGVSTNPIPAGQVTGTRSTTAQSASAYAIQCSNPAFPARSDDRMQVQIEIRPQGFES
jgi:hypothetical protein